MADADNQGPPPRAFAQGTGVLLQMVGGLMFLTSGCVCCSAFLWDPQWSPAEAQQAVGDQGPDQSWVRFGLDNPAKFGVMLTVMFTTLGGLALLVFGLGLQSEKRRAAWAALVSNVLLLMVLVVAGVNLWLGGAAIVTLIWHGLVTLVTACLLGFTITALRQVLADPPSGDWHVVPADFDPKKEMDEGP